VIAFHSGTPPKGFKPDFESFLFNTKKHRSLQSKSGWLEFHLLDFNKKQILSSIYFNISNYKASSPLKAPFGSFEISLQVQLKDFCLFVQQIEVELKKEGVRKIEIQCPPELYISTQPLVTATLSMLGFKIIEAQPGCCIIVNKKSLFEKMFKDKKIKFRLAQKTGLTFKKLSLLKLSEVYSFIAKFRRKLNRTLSMSSSELAKTVKALPHSFLIVGVFLKGRMIAACICVIVSNSILYTFYSAHDDEFDKLSPRIFLLSNLYGWCQKNKVTLLDLGTSGVKDKPNPGLLDFKIRIGGTLTPKYKFEKELDL